MSKGNSEFDLEDRLIDEALIIVSTMLCYGYKLQVRIYPHKWDDFFTTQFSKTAEHRPIPETFSQLLSVVVVTAIPASC